VDCLEPAAGSTATGGSLEGLKPEARVRVRARARVRVTIRARVGVRVRGTMLP